MVLRGDSLQISGVLKSMRLQERRATSSNNCAEGFAIIQSLRKTSSERHMDQEIMETKEGLIWPGVS